MSAPAPPSGPDPLRDAERNARLNALEGTAWHVTIACLAWTTVLPAYVARLGGGPLASAAVVGLLFLGIGLPQALSSWQAHGRARTRGLLLGLALLQRLAVLGLALAALGARPGPASLALFFVFYAAFAFAIGLTYPVWVDFMGRALHPARAGRALGLRTAVGNAAGVAASLVVAALLARLPFPRSYAAVFGTGAVVFAAGLVPLALLREPPHPDPSPRGWLGAYLRSCLALPRREPALVRLLAGLALLTAIRAPVGLLLPCALARFGAGLDPGARDALAGAYSVAQTLVLAASAWPAGRLADRVGGRPVLVLGALAGAASPLLALAAPGTRSYALVFAAQGLSLATFNVGVLKLYLELARGEARGQVVVLAETAVAPLTLVATLLGGAVAARTGFAAVFLPAAAAALLGTALVVASGRRRT